MQALAVGQAPRMKKDKETRRQLKEDIGRVQKQKVLTMKWKKTNRLFQKDSLLKQQLIKATSFKTKTHKTK